jgi:hypothetical protein
LQETEKIERRVNVVAPTHVGLSFLAPTDTCRSGNREAATA